MFLSLLVVVLLGFVVVLLTPEVTEKLDLSSLRPYLLFSTGVVLFMISTRDLLWGLVGLELLSVVTFARDPRGARRRHRVLVSALGSAMLFVGLGSLALAGGSSDLARIAAAAVSPSLPVTCGVVLSVTGVAVKWSELSSRLWEIRAVGSVDRGPGCHRSPGGHRVAVSENRRLAGPDGLFDAVDGSAARAGSGFRGPQPRGTCSDEPGADPRRACRHAGGSLCGLAFSEASPLARRSWFISPRRV